MVACGVLGAAAIGIVSGAGCSGRYPATVPVHGTVRMDGKPLAGGRIDFRPEEGRLATAAIDPEGRYALTTFRPGDGAVPGTHRVTVTFGRETKQPIEEGIEQPIEWVVPQRYGDPATTPLRADVSPGNDRIDFDLPSN